MSCLLSDLNASQKQHTIPEYNNFLYSRTLLAQIDEKAAQALVQEHRRLESLQSICQVPCLFWAKGLGLSRVRRHKASERRGAGVLGVGRFTAAVQWVLVKFGSFRMHLLTRIQQ